MKHKNKNLISIWINSLLLLIFLLILSSSLFAFKILKPVDPVTDGPDISQRKNMNKPEANIPYP